MNIILIIILALGLRLTGLNQSLWMDEAISATVVNNYSISYIWNDFILSDTHPPLYYILLKIWTNIFGYSEVSLRFPSVIMGALSVYILYRISLLVNKNIASLSALLLATSGLHIYYSQETRMYSMTLFLVVIIVYLYLRKKWILISLSILMLGITDYFPLVIIFPIYLFEVFVGKSKDFKKLFFSCLPLVLFYIYWLPNFLIQRKSTMKYLSTFPEWKSVLGSSSIKELFFIPIKFITGRVSFENNFVYLIVAGIMVSFSLYLLYKTLEVVKIHKKSLFMWFVVIFPIFILFGTGLFTPGFTYFRLIFILPFYLVLLSLGVSKSKNSILIGGLLIFMNLTFSSLYIFNQKYWREDWKTLVPFVEENLKENELVLVSYKEPFTPYVWYSKISDKIAPFSKEKANLNSGVYTLDYLMDLTDPNRENYKTLELLGFIERNIYNFRGTGQVRYWKRI